MKLQFIWIFFFSFSLTQMQSFMATLTVNAQCVCIFCTLRVYVCVACIYFNIISWDGIAFVWVQCIATMKNIKQIHVNWTLCKWNKTELNSDAYSVEKKEKILNTRNIKSIWKWYLLSITLERIPYGMFKRYVGWSI